MDKNNNNNSSPIFEELPESVLQYISGGQNVSFQGRNGCIFSVSTNQHKISLIPTYHAIYEKTKQFLEQKKESNDLYVIIDGEPNPIPKSSKIDVVITTKRDLNKGDIYIPYYVLYAEQFKKPLGDLYIGSLPKRVSFNEFQAREFIVFCYSNNNVTRYSGSANRAQFYKLLNLKLKSRAHVMGKQCQGIHTLITDIGANKDRKFSNNDLMFKKYKFVVAFENQEIKGYITEKFINPLLGGCIPVYLGASDINEHFNPECFINVNNYTSYDACIDDLLALEQDETRLKKMLSAIPILQDTFLGYLKPKGGEIWKQFKNTPLSYLIPPTRLHDERISFVTFIPGKAPKSSKLTQYAEESKCFDEIIILDSEHLSYDFLEKNDEFISKNENLGFGIWKPNLILAYLQNMTQGEILVFANNNFDLQSLFKSCHFNKQYEELMNVYKSSDKKVSIAAIGHKNSSTEYNNTKMDCLMNVLKLPTEKQTEKIVDITKEQTQLDTIGNSPHIHSDYFVVVKCESSMALVREWVEFCQYEKYRLLDQSKSLKKEETKQFQKHNHENSIFSCLMKREKQLILYS
jgi:hypothetical protein